MADESGKARTSTHVVRDLLEDEALARKAMFPDGALEQLQKQARAFSDQLKLPQLASAQLTEQWAKLNPLRELTGSSARLAEMMHGSRKAAEALNQLTGRTEGFAAVVKQNLKIADAMKPVTDMLNLTERLGGFLAVSKAVEEAAAFHRSIFEACKPASQLVDVWKPDNRLVEAMQQLAQQTADIRAHFTMAGADAARALSGLIPSEKFAWFAEQERGADLVESFGFVPHGEVLAIILDEEYALEDGAEATDQLADEFAKLIWPQMKPRLELTLQQCLNDARLAAIYGQMIEAHEAGMFEIVRNTTAPAIERAATIGRKSTKSSQRMFEWLRDEIGSLTSSECGGFSGYRLWNVLTEHTFASCYDDSVADANKYPNRHASAHGIGSKTATYVDSMNSILMVHFVILAVAAVLEYHFPPKLDS